MNAKTRDGGRKKRRGIRKGNRARDKKEPDS